MSDRKLGNKNLYRDDQFNKFKEYFPQGSL